jgi:hypothetical protein
LKLQNGRTLIELDAECRSIVRLQDTVLGMDHLEGGDWSRLFRVITPTVDWVSRYADSQDQAPPEIEEDGGGVTLGFPELVAADGATTGIAVEVRIEPSASADEMLLTLQVENRGVDEINEIVFPWVGGWNGQGGPGKDLMLVGAGIAFNPHGFPAESGATYARRGQRLDKRFAYPTGLNVPWVDLSGPDGGISYINYMPEARNGYVAIENLAGYGPGLHLGWGWAHCIVVRPGESWTSPSMGIAAHQGDWHETADRYRAWMDEHLQPSPGADVARRMTGFQNVFFRSFDGQRLRDYEEIPAVAATGRRYGVDHLCIWDHLPIGNYVPHPERDLMDYDEADREAITAGIEQARAEGSSVSALVNFRHLNPTSQRFGGHAASEIKRCYDGSPQTENWSGSAHHGVLFVEHLGPEANLYSPFSAVYQERMMRLTGEYLAMGYNSMFFDQPWEKNPDYAFVGAGCAPDTTQAAVGELLRQVRERLTEGDPQSLMIGEECDAFGQQWIDMWMSWSWSALSAAERVARQRYSLPNTVLAWMVDSELERASLAFALGMSLCICVHGNEATLADEPELAEHVGKLAALKSATVERTTMARFNDQLGLEIEGDEGFYAYSYDSAAGPAVIVAAPGGEAAGRVTVDRTAFTGPGSETGEVHRLDGSVAQVTGDTRDFQLAMNEVAVWVL